MMHQTIFVFISIWLKNQTLFVFMVITPPSQTSQTTVVVKNTLRFEDREKKIYSQTSIIRIHWDLGK